MIAARQNQIYNHFDAVRAIHESPLHKKLFKTGPNYFASPSLVSACFGVG